MARVYERKERGKGRYWIEWLDEYGRKRRKCIGPDRRTLCRRNPALRAVLRNSGNSSTYEFRILNKSYKICFILPSRVTVGES